MVVVVLLKTKMVQLKMKKYIYPQSQQR